jgi:two-component system, LuxR family, response regulator FixJ
MSPSLALALGCLPLGRDVQDRPMVAGTIYIVDDDAPVRDSLRVLLESYGWAVEDFESIAGFLARRRRGDGSALLILDQHLPGASGLEFLGSPQGASLGLPVILITGAGDSSVREQAYRRGVANYIEKPVNEMRLLDAIARALKDTPGHDR